MITISRKNFDSLEENEKSILLALGIKIERPKPIPKSETPRKTITVKSFCRTCHHTTEKLFLMRGTVEFTTSELLPPGTTPPPNLPNEVMTETLIRCGNCRRRLQSLSKEELIERILKL